MSLFPSFLSPPQLAPKQSTIGVDGTISEIWKMNKHDEHVRPLQTMMGISPPAKPVLMASICKVCFASQLLSWTCQSKHSKPGPAPCYHIWPWDIHLTLELIGNPWDPLGPWGRGSILGPLPLVKGRHSPSSWVKPGDLHRIKLTPPSGPSLRHFWAAQACHSHQSHHPDGERRFCQRRGIWLDHLGERKTMENKYIYKHERMWFFLLRCCTKNWPRAASSWMYLPHASIHMQQLALRRHSVTFWNDKNGKGRIVHGIIGYPPAHFVSGPSCR